MSSMGSKHVDSKAHITLNSIEKQTFAKLRLEPETSYAKNTKKREERKEKQVMGVNQNP